MKAEGLRGRRVVVTGAASGIGREIVLAFRAAGSEVAALDRNEAGLRTLADAAGCATFACDVTDPVAVHETFGAARDALGGLDIVVSNAGAAAQGPIGDVPIDTLRSSFELNFFAHHLVAQAALRLFPRRRHGRPDAVQHLEPVAQAALRLFRAAGTGGLMLFNISNQSVNAGRHFGPYGIAKAALLALMRQYALDHGEEGIRANGVNAGRIRTGLLDDETISGRSAARGVSVEEYMSGNLLGVEVTAADVADAFVHLALMDKVNAAVLTVDGGNVATALR